MSTLDTNISHLEVTTDPNALLYSEPIAFVDQCKLLSEPIRQLKIAWGNKDTFPRILEILMRMNWYAQRLPLQPKGSFARPSGFMECSIKRATHTLQILTTLSFYPRLPTTQKYLEIERVKLTAVIAALLSSVGEPAVNFEVVSYDNNRQLIRRKNEYERLDTFLGEDAEYIHINFQDPPPKEFYSSIAIDLLHEIVPEDLMQDIALAYDRNLRRFLQNYVGRNFLLAEVVNEKLFNCLISADVITQDREFAFSGKRVDKTPLPHLQHEMEIVLAHKFKGDWSKESGKSKYARCVTLWKGEMWIRYPLGFEEIAELARLKWPFTEIPLNAQSLFSYCSYLGIVKQPPNSDLEERVFLERKSDKSNASFEEVLCPAVVLNEPILYLEETSVWAHDLKECLPEKLLEQKLKKKQNIKNIVADLDKKKADTTLSIRKRKEFPIPTETPSSGSSIISMAREMINEHIQKLEKERQIMKGSPVEVAKKAVNENAVKTIDKKRTLEMEESFKKENLYPFNQVLPEEKPIVESKVEMDPPPAEAPPSLIKRILMWLVTPLQWFRRKDKAEISSERPVSPISPVYENKKDEETSKRNAQTIPTDSNTENQQKIASPESLKILNLKTVSLDDTTLKDGTSEEAKEKKDPSNSFVTLDPQNLPKATTSTQLEKESKTDKIVALKEADSQSTQETITGKATQETKEQKVTAKEDSPPSAKPKTKTKAKTVNSSSTTVKATSTKKKTPKASTASKPASKSQATKSSSGEANQTATQPKTKASKTTRKTTTTSKTSKTSNDTKEAETKTANSQKKSRTKTNSKEKKATELKASTESATSPIAKEPTP